MKLHQLDFTVETYSDLKPERKFRYYKAFDIEGERKIRRFNFVFTPFRVSYWLSVRFWRKV